MYKFWYLLQKIIYTRSLMLCLARIFTLTPPVILAHHCVIAAPTPLAELHNSDWFRDHRMNGCRGTGRRSYHGLSQLGLARGASQPTPETSPRQLQTVHDARIRTMHDQYRSAGIALHPLSSGVDGPTCGCPMGRYFVGTDPSACRGRESRLRRP